MKIFFCNKNMKNNKIFGRVIANTNKKLCLNWKNKNKTLDLLIIISNKLAKQYS